MKPEDVSPEASAALTRSFNAGQSWIIGGEEPTIAFSEEGFQSWFLAEHERQVRAKVAAEVEAPLALTNAEMAELSELADDGAHEACAGVFQRYFARVTRGEAT